MANLRVLPLLDSGSDEPKFMPSATVRHLLAIGKVQQISKKTYRLLSALDGARPEVSAEILIASGYDGAASRLPDNYRVASPAKLMLGQMWEKRASAGFEILQLCPPHIKREPAEVSA